MLAPANNSFDVSKSPHSIGLDHNLTIPSPGLDDIEVIQETHRNLIRGLQGLGRHEDDAYGGMSGLTFDGTGLFGTGLFSGDITTWGAPEAIAGLIGLYGVYAMFFQAKSTKYRIEQGAGRRRRSKASKLRAKAKQLEEQTTGIF